MYITEWFEIDNKNHLLAYLHLSKKGVWPKDFIPSQIRFQPHWLIMLQSKMAEKYVKDKLKGII